VETLLKTEHREEQQEQPPKDHYNLVYISFFFFGLGGWIAWNAAIAGIDYFDSRFKPKYNPKFFFGFVFTLPLVLGNVLLLYVDKKISLSKRINIGLIVITWCTFSMPFITEYFPETLAWWIMILIIATNGLANAFVQGGLFGFASIFPAKYITLMLTTQSLNGVVLYVTKIFWLLVLPPDNDRGKEDMNVYYNSLIFITTGTLIVITWTVLYNITLKLEFSKYYIRKAQTSDEIVHVLEVKSIDTTFLNLNPSMMNSTVASPVLKAPEDRFSWWELYKKISVLGFQAFMIYFTTFVIFPGVMLSTKLDMFNHSSARVSWFDITMVTVYAVIDTIGRWLANYWIPFTHHNVIWMTMSRLVHIPISILIQLAVPPNWLFGSDWFRLLNISIFGFTMGYNTAVVMIFGPQLIKNTEKEQAGILMNFHLWMGQCVGTLVAAFGFNYIPQLSEY
jgi:solute carrier family 29 (equilibrative nucleoside transporter), member 1/2/3